MNGGVLIRPLDTMYITSASGLDSGAGAGG